MSQPVHPPPFPILSLPLELRTQIYEAILHPFYTHVSTTHLSPTPPRLRNRTELVDILRESLPISSRAFLYSCRQISSEVFEMIYRVFGWTLNYYVYPPYLPPPPSPRREHEHKAGDDDEAGRSGRLTPAMDGYFITLTEPTEVFSPAIRWIRDVELRIEARGPFSSSSFMVMKKTQPWARLLARIHINPQAPWFTGDVEAETSVAAWRAPLRRECRERVMACLERVTARREADLRVQEWRELVACARKALVGCVRRRAGE
jgi:hypothetical protein